MIEPKLRLSLNVLGTKLLSSQECEENPNNSFNTHVISFSHRNKKGKLIREEIPVKTRKQGLVRQSISISKDAYNYMIAPECPPDEKTAKRVVITKTVKKSNEKSKKITKESTVWAQLPVKQRLDWHLSRLASDLKAVSYSYEILED